MLPYLVIDFDKTFVQVESLDELARIALRDVEDRDERVAAIAGITEDGMNGKIGFGTSLTRRLEMFHASRSHLEELVKFLKTTVTPSIAHSRKYFEDHADQIYIISGGFREYIVPIALEYGLASDHVLANTFSYDSEGLIIGCDKSNPLAQDGGKEKVLALLNLAGPVTMVGDGYSDYQTKVAGAADEFVAFTENIDRKSVTAGADHVARNFDEVVKLVESSNAVTMKG